ncbi:MAG: helix-turn-helix domain-containing protein [Candidatus Bipolaricaulia bacterium]
MEFYTSQEVAEQTEVPYRTLMRWVKQGLIDPTVPGRRGRQTLFTKEEFREVAILAKLRKFLSVKQLREALNYLRSLGHNPLSEGDFAIVRDIRGERALFKICKEGDVIKVMEEEPGQLRLFPIYDVEELIKEAAPIRKSSEQGYWTD